MANHPTVITALEPGLNRCTTAIWPCPIGIALSIAEHPRASQVKTIRVIVKFSPTPGEVGRPAPPPGEHPRAILGDGPPEIVALVDESLMAAAAGAGSAGNP